MEISGASGPAGPENALQRFIFWSILPNHFPAGKVRQEKQFWSEVHRLYLSSNSVTVHL